MKNQKNKYFRRIHIVIVLTLLFSACTNHNKIINIIGFNEKQWQNDSLACNKYRYEHYELLYSKRQILIGLKEKSISNFLGMPNKMGIRKESISYYYYITEGEQCKPNANQIKLKENPLLRILFKNDTVSDINVIIP